MTTNALESPLLLTALVAGLSLIMLAGRVTAHADPAATASFQRNK